MRITLIVGLVIATIGIAAWLVVRALAWIDRRRRQRRAIIAQAGEQTARKWLEAQGFAVREEQARTRGRMLVDGTLVEYDACVDYLVERNGRRGLVEVKTGAAAHPTARTTRRQIFEYAALFDADDVHVFDANAMRLHTVTFARANAARPAGLAWGQILWGFAAGAVVASGAVMLIR